MAKAIRKRPWVVDVVELADNPHDVEVYKPLNGITTCACLRSRRKCKCLIIGAFVDLPLELAVARYIKDGDGRLRAVYKFRGLMAYVLPD